MTGHEAPILVVGATIVYDYIFRVDALPQPGRTAAILPDDESAPPQPLPGGTAFNIALVLARLGRAARISHPVGYDFAGSAYERALREAGVDLAGLLVNERHPSGVAYVFGAADGATVCFTSATPLPRPRIAEGALAGAGLIVLTPLAGPWHLQAAEYARRHGIPLAVCGMGVAEVLDWLPHMVLLSINEYEMQLLAGVEPGLTPQLLSRRMPGHLLITHGARGCSVYHQGERQAVVPAIPAARVVDTTGAGDAFFATTLAALCRGYDATDAARAGVAAGSLVVEALGCQTNLPDWPALARRLSAHYPALAEKIKKSE